MSSVSRYDEYFNGNKEPTEFPLEKLKQVSKYVNWVFHPPKKDYKITNKLVFRHDSLSKFFLKVYRDKEPVFIRHYEGDTRLIKKNSVINDLLIDLISYELKDYHLVFGEDEVKVMNNLEKVASLDRELFPDCIDFFRVFYHDLEIIFKSHDFLELLGESESFLYY